jgi:putative intracellular protease/amidase
VNKRSFCDQKAAILVESGCCERELSQAIEALEELSIKCHFVSSESTIVKSWNEDRVNRKNSCWVSDYAANGELSVVHSSDYTMLVIPGGRRSLEKLKLNGSLRTFISGFILTEKPVVAYNGAISLLADLGFVNGYSVAATREVCENAKVSGARCASPDFVVSKNLITLSRYRNAEKKIISAITAVLSGEPYVEKIVSSENIPWAHAAA